MKRTRPSKERREIERLVDEQLGEAGGKPSGDRSWGAYTRRPSPKGGIDKQRVNRIIDQLVNQLNRVRMQHPDIGIGDTSTDGEIADAFALLLKGKEVHPDANIFALLPPEDVPADYDEWEDSAIQQATRDIVNLLSAAASRIRKAGGVDAEDIVDAFYTKFHYAQ